MIWRRDQDGFAGRISAAGGAITEITRIAIFFVLIASIAGVLAAGAVAPGEPSIFENAPLCLHGS